MREIADPVDPDTLSPIARDIFRQRQRGKALERFVFLEGCSRLTADGTQYFSSKHRHGSSCSTSTNSTTAEVTASPQMLAAAIVHADLSEVIPVFPEAIEKQDGETRNDCERNAAKRVVTQVRHDHPPLNVILTEDGLHSNAPHIRTLQPHTMRFMIGAKASDHGWFFDRLDEAVNAGTATEFPLKEAGLLRSMTSPRPLSEGEGRLPPLGAGPLRSDVCPERAMSYQPRVKPWECSLKRSFRASSVIRSSSQGFTLGYHDSRRWRILERNSPA